jgi:hypothetical protein
MKMYLIGGMLMRVAKQQRTNEDIGQESCDLFPVWSSLCKIELGFLCVVRAEAI